MEPLVSHNIHEIIDRLQTAKQIRDHYAQEFLTRYRKAQIKWADHKGRIQEEREMLLRWIRKVKKDVPKQMRTPDIAYRRTWNYAVHVFMHRMADTVKSIHKDVGYKAFHKYYSGLWYGQGSYVDLTYQLAAGKVTVSRIDAIPLAFPHSFELEPLLPRIWQLGTGIDPKGQPSLFAS